MRGGSRPKRSLRQAQEIHEQLGNGELDKAVDWKVKI